MKQQYNVYENVTREILDTVKVGDLIKVNDWKKPMKVKAVSENYFVMTQNIFGNIYYSVCSKLPWEGIRHNDFTGGMYHCGPDDYIFGSPLCADYDDLYTFEDEVANRKYLESFENGETQLSERRGICIDSIAIKSN